MWKRPPMTGLAGALRVLAADWKQRYFGLVAFEVETMFGSHPRQALLLCWFESEDAFDLWLTRLTPSAIFKASFKFMYALTGEGGRRSFGTATGVAHLGPPQTYSSIVFGRAELRAIDMEEVLGSLAMPSVSSVRESLRMDLPYRTLELAAPGRTFLLGVEPLDAFLEWRHRLATANLELAERLIEPVDTHALAAYGASDGDLSAHAGHARWPRTSARRLLGYAPGKPRTLLPANGSTSAESTERPNKWTFELPLGPFRWLWYALVLFGALWLPTLIIFMHPSFAPCAYRARSSGLGGTVTFNASAAVCQESGSAVAIDSCVGADGWAWVHLGFFGRAGPECFQRTSGLDLALFWLFVLSEAVSVWAVSVSAAFHWRPVRRGARQLHELVPDFPRAQWPRVDLLICHFGEEARDTIETLKAALAQQYDAAKLHVYVCDDGYFKSDFRGVHVGVAGGEGGGGEHWPRPLLNRVLLLETGNVREAVREFMDALATERQAATALRTRSVMPDPKSPARAVPRVDCAAGFVEDRYELEGLPTVSYVARLKPRTHHSKSGNINNVLYNVQAVCHDESVTDESRIFPWPTPLTYRGGAYTCIFDNDMRPHPQFVVSTLPLFFEIAEVPDRAEGRSGGIGDGANDAASIAAPAADASTTMPRVDARAPQCAYTDDPERNTFAFVQTPQYFKSNELMRSHGDLLAHENATFFDAALPGMDGYDSVMFVGTNVTWRREALDSIGGLQVRSD